MLQEGCSVQMKDELEETVLVRGGCCKEVDSTKHPNRELEQEDDEQQ